MKAKALKKYIRSSPRKMRLVIDLIRGKKVQEALNILKFSNQISSKVAEMTLRSAVSNLNNKAENAETTINENDIFISATFVNQGPTMKRIQPAPMGRAFRVRKRSNHLTIEVSDGQAEINSENEELKES
ncbi:50S ribosomal protein L22 [Candidatus Kapabacteria bacterium]|nr:50S ribosomal protein L22 [Candidatus Kapabacteria bacterium]